MTADQLSLLDVPATRGASRRSDPQTSRDAGRSMEGHVLRDQQWVVLYYSERAGRSRGGCTAWECWTYIGGAQNNRAPKENVISKRMQELRAMGMLELGGETRPGSSARHQMVHVVTAAGHAALDRRPPA